MRPREPRRRTRRDLLAAAGIVPAALLAGCAPDAEPDPAPSPQPGAARCQAGSVVPPPSAGASDKGGADGARRDDSVLSPAGLAPAHDGRLLAANAGLGRKLAGTSATAGTVLWSTADGSIVRRFDNELTGAIAWHPAGELLAIGGPQHIELTTPEGEVLWTLTGHGAPLPRYRAHTVHDLAFTPDGSTLASLGPDAVVRLWTGIGSGCAPGMVLDTSALLPLSIAASPDGATIAVAGTEGPVELWDIVAGQRRAVVEGTEFSPHAVAFAPDGTLLIGTGAPAEHTADDPSHAVVYESSHGDEAREAARPQGRDVGWIAVAPGGERIAAVSTVGDQVMVRESGGASHDLPATSGSTGRIAWSVDGRALYGAAPSKGVIAWDGTDWTSWDQP